MHAGGLYQYNPYVTIYLLAETHVVFLLKVGVIVECRLQTLLSILFAEFFVERQSAWACTAGTCGGFPLLCRRLPARESHPSPRRAISPTSPWPDPPFDNSEPRPSPRSPRASKAMPRPIPREPPVTNAVFPLSVIRHLLAQNLRRMLGPCKSQVNRVPPPRLRAPEP